MLFNEVARVVKIRLFIHDTWGLFILKMFVEPERLLLFFYRKNLLKNTKKADLLN